MSLYIKEMDNNDAPIIIFLHGGGVSGWMWDKQAKYFADYHVIIPDLPGHGRSSNIKFSSIRTAAEEIISIIESKAMGKKVYIIGFSLGAQIAVEILSTKPQIIDKAIICSALVRPIGFGKGLIDATLKMSSGFMKNRSFQKLQAKVMYIDDEYFDVYYNEVLQTRKEDMLDYMNANMLYKLPQTFGEHSVETLVLVGSKERGIMQKSALDLLRANRACKGCILPEIGHGIPLAEPEVFNRTVEAWIKGEMLPSELKALTV